MSEQIVARETQKSTSPLKQAVYRNKIISKQGMLERLFAAVFDNLVYPQIWEDPIVDMRAMAIKPGDHVVTISSGGCNVLSYLTADPGRISAVDLNPAHLALTQLKLTAMRHLPAHDDFHQFFVKANSPANEGLYEAHLVRHLDEDSRSFWSGRDVFFKRRIKLFSRGFYRYGMLGYFIYLAHLAAKFYGVNPAGIMAARTLEEQRRFFDEYFSPLFDKKLVRWLTSSPVSLYGLGIPPAQYRELAGGRHMADVLRDRLEKLSCDYLLKDNYFARQAFSRSYFSEEMEGSLPPYLEAENWDIIRQRAGQVGTYNVSMTDLLADAPAGSVDCVVLLDAQDWMSDEQLNALWAAINKSAAPGARVIFRTAAIASPLEARVDPAILSRWRYEHEASRQHTADDRSAIYGGFHLYELDK